MHVLLLFAGLIIAAASAATLGYQAAGARIGAADALTVTAIIGLVGGFILVGLSAIAGQVRRIADALEAQPVGRSLDFLPERRPADAAAMAGTNAVAAALALDPEPPAMPAPPVEPPMAPALEPSLEPPGEPTVRPSTKVQSQVTVVVTPPVIPASAREPEGRDDKAPPVLSPVAASVAAPGAPAPVAAPAGLAEWPHVDIADRPVPTADDNARASVEPALGPRAPAPPVRSPAAPPERPAPQHPAPQRPAAERVGPERPEAKQAMSERAAPAVAAPEPASAPKPDAPRVLKSGVIEGMAYTLFSDGSVDAELPQGTTHFPSISAWRAHLRENT